ncbi:MAG: PqqD family protein [Ruminococcaceae bacterium]|nr:PqqD family protein [Oscillospiraceae bacterium]
MHIPSGFIIRKVAGETVAVPTGEAARSLSGLVALAGCGEFLFELLKEEQTEQSLVDALLENFNVDSDTALADVREFLAILRKNGILIDN